MHSLTIHIRAAGQGGHRVRAGLMTAGLLLGSAGLLAACGGTGYGPSAAGSSGSGGSANGVIKTADNAKLGTILTDASGKTLYSPEQEKSGKILCTGACTGFWYPLISPSAMPSPSAKLSGKMATVKRPDTGKLQVTYNGMPLYTFQLDKAAGDTKGNDFSDQFGGNKFTWYAMTPKGSTESDSNSGSNSTPSSSPTSGGGYNY